MHRVVRFFRVVSIFCTDFFALYSGDETREAPSVFVLFQMYPTTGTPWLTFTFSPRQDESLAGRSFSEGKLVLPLFHFQLPSRGFEVSLFQFGGQVESRETLRAITVIMGDVGRWGGAL